MLNEMKYKKQKIIKLYSSTHEKKNNVDTAN